MTISPVSLADIEQTMTELQQAPGVPQVGSASASAVDGASGSGDDFATSLAQATGTGTGTTSDLFAGDVQQAGHSSVCRPRMVFLMGDIESPGELTWKNRTLCLRRATATSCA